MARKKKSWIEKLEDAKAKEDLPKKFYCDKSKQHMLVPSASGQTAEATWSAMIDATDAACPLSAVLTRGDQSVT